MRIPNKNDTYSHLFAIQQIQHLVLGELNRQL